MLPQVVKASVFKYLPLKTIQLLNDGGLVLTDSLIKTI